MKRSKILTVTSVVSMVLLTVHVADDIAHGFDSAGLINFIAIAVVAGFLYATLVLRERMVGRIVILLVAIASLGMPLIHLRSVRINDVAQASGGMFFIWTLWALGILGLFGLVLAIQELISGPSKSEMQSEG